MTHPLRHTDLHFDTDDGVRISATHWHGTAAGRGVVVIAAATGVRQRLYRRFAEYLVDAGFEALTFDWRGIGGSRTAGGHRDARLTMHNWGARDLRAALAWADHRAAGRAVHFVGHSFGGQALGLAPNAARVERALLVGAQHGWMGHWPLARRVPLWLLWRIGMPLSARLFGQFPSPVLGMGEALPRGVALEWARWCSRPAFIDRWDGHAALTIPMLALSFADDAFAPLPAVQALLRHYAQARITHAHESAIGLGHFGFFRGGAALPLWERALQFFSATGR